MYCIHKDAEHKYFDFVKDILHICGYMVIHMPKTTQNRLQPDMLSQYIKTLFNQITLFALSAIVIVSNENLHNMLTV